MEAVCIPGRRFVRPSSSFLDRAKSHLGSTGGGPLRPLTRREFYELAEQCRAYAQELARHDQNRVSLKHCHEFNQWLVRVKSYDLLRPYLATLRPARPIARWQVLILAVVAGLVGLLVFGPNLDRAAGSMILYGYMLSLLLFGFFIPERLYGTTIELLEGKVLRVVDALEQVLLSDALGFSEAAYFRVKEDLQVSKRELRQQIDLAHRRWR
jgi:hypothetical protein